MNSGIINKQRYWSNVVELYNDGDFSVIWGNFTDDPKPCLGIRWNGENENSVGFPRNGGEKLWFVLPNSLAGMVLLALYEKVGINLKDGNLEKILEVIKECKN